MRDMTVKNLNVEMRHKIKIYVSKLRSHRDIFNVT